MANDKHLKILRDGVEAWNEWRNNNPEVVPDFGNSHFNRADLRGANLSEADLGGADLREAVLYGANLSGANFSEADLRRAILSESNLSGADLSRSNLSEANLSRANLNTTNLSEANLSGADFGGAVLSGANLSGANFSYVIFHSTILSYLDLRGAINLEEAYHFGPSEITISTIYKSNGEISEAFLRRAGMPENFIAYMSSFTSKAFEYFSAFISYTEVDDTFSKRLYEGLQATGLRVWRWREDAKWGAPIEKNIDQAVRIYDKLIVICSKDSLNAPAVIDEIDRALQKEHQLMKERKVPEVLFPITIDDYIFNEWDHYLKPKVMAKTVGDFRGWEDPRKYDAALERLIAALKQENNNGLQK